MYQLVLLFIFSVSTVFGASIEGFWKTMDDDMEKPTSLIAVYEYENTYYGRIVAIFDEQGKIKESIYKPKERFLEITGSPYRCGFDLIWDMRVIGASYKGKIVNPESGNVYNVELWVKDGDLKVRGKKFGFFQTRTWLPAEASDFPKDFKMPDLSSFIPSIPAVN